MNYFAYFSEIEETFIRLRGRNLLLSPLDWALIEAWKQRGVPLHVALRAIEAVFEKRNKNATSHIKSLMYCREEVEDQYKEWLATQIGKSEAETPKVEVKKPEEPNIEPSANDANSNAETGETSGYFLKIKENLRNIETRNGLREAISSTLSAVEKLEKKFSGQPVDLEILENSLVEIEQNLDDFLVEHTEKSYLETTTKEIEKMLRPYKPRMADEIYRQTRQNLLLKRLREDFNVPRLSLFYL
jgi:hypothetical protein